jgi:hypothetical protein
MSHRPHRAKRVKIIEIVGFSVKISMVQTDTRATPPHDN